MAEQTNPFNQSESEVNRLGFVADLAFVLCFAWLGLWRGELFTADSESIWTSGWPALVLAGLVAAAFTMGFLQRRPRGFLPVALRWGFLAACLILPAWIALAVADVRPPMLMQTAADELRESAEVAKAAASTPEAKRDAEATLETSTAVKALGQALDAAKARGIEVPHKDLSSLGYDPVALAELPAETRKTLEQAAGLAEMQSGQSPAPPGLSDLLHEFGLDNPLVQKALLGLAAATLGPLLGLSPALIEAVLSALLIEGGLSLENIVQVTLALSLSTTKAGNLSATKFKRNIKTIRRGAELVDKIHAELKKRGAGDSPGMQAFKEAAPDRVQRSPSCNKAIAAAAKLDDHEQAKRQLRQACPELTPVEIDELAAGRP